MNRSNSLSTLRQPLGGRDKVTKGVYVLILFLPRARRVVVGKLGTIAFERGFYAYVGSAMGPAGFKRVARHLDVSEGRLKTKRWHVDHLLAVAKVLATVEITTQQIIECKVARELLENASLACTENFGSSDCKCRSHLFYSPRFDDIENAMRKLISDCRLETSCTAVAETNWHGSARFCEARLSRPIHDDPERPDTA
jgi:Uri superfamily endonuclease